MFLIGFLIFASGVAIGFTAALILKENDTMAAIDDLNASIDALAARVATLQTAADPGPAIAAAVAANQAVNDTAIEAAKAKVDAIDAAPPAPAPAA